MGWNDFGSVYYISFKIVLLLVFAAKKYLAKLFFGQNFLAQKTLDDTNFRSKNCCPQFSRPDFPGHILINDQNGRFQSRLTFVVDHRVIRRARIYIFYKFSRSTPKTGFYR